MGHFYRTPLKTLKTVAATTTPEKITTTGTPATRAIVCGLKGLSPRVENATRVWLGVESADGSQMIEIPPGGNYILEGVDLSEWYIDVETNGDGVVVLYW